MKQKLQQVSKVIGNISHILVDQDLKEKIRKHLSDMNDVITDEDLKKVRTDIFSLRPAFNNPS